MSDPDAYQPEEPEAVPDAPPEPAPEPDAPPAPRQAAPEIPRPQRFQTPALAAIIAEAIYDAHDREGRALDWPVIDAALTRASRGIKLGWTRFRDGQPVKF